MEHVDKENSLEAQVKELRNLTAALIDQVKCQNEALLETRAQIKEQAEVLRFAHQMVDQDDVVANDFEEGERKIFIGTPVNKTPVENAPAPVEIPAVHYVMSSTTVQPEKFSGTRKHYGLQSFKLAVERIFALSQGRFQSENLKVIYIGSLLEGPAQAWFNSIQSSQSEEAFLIMNN